MNVLSLFDGISGAMLSLKAAGIKVNNYYASEIDRHCLKVSQHNFPNIIQLGDVKEIRKNKLPKIQKTVVLCSLGGKSTPSTSGACAATW